MQDNTLKPLMRCGHTAQGVDQKSGNPVCMICSGIREGADVVAAKLPDLTGRVAHCTECRNTATSNILLAFFKHNPGQKEDSYYCGCHGWE